MSLCLNQVTVKHGNTKTLKNITIQIPTNPGITGLIGPNGAGKTTLIETALGLRPFVSGQITYDGSPISYCQDSPEFESGLTANEIVKSSLLQSGLPGESRKISKVFSEVGLENVKNKHANNFSRGMKQRLGLATCLVLSPDVLFLDEPTSALDPFGRKELLRLISELSARMRIIISTHLLEDVGEIANNIIVLNNGELAFSGDKDEFLSGYVNNWEVLSETAEECDIVTNFLNSKMISYDLVPGSELGVLVSSHDIPNLFAALKDGPYQHISSIKPSKKQMYSAFEAVVRNMRDD